MAQYLVYLLNVLCTFDENMSSVAIEGNGVFYKYQLGQVASVQIYYILADYLIIYVSYQENGK